MQQRSLGEGLKDSVYLARSSRGATASKCDAAKKEATNDPPHPLQTGQEAIGLNCNKGNVG